MPRYAALLRAINVGGHVVKMSELCALFERAKLSNVRSVIASGNVLFDTRATDIAAIERRIEGTLRAALGYDVDTYVRSPEELDAIVAHEPFDASDPVLERDTVQVVFTRSTIDAAARERIAALRTWYDDFAVFGRELFWRTRGRISDSAITPARFSRALGGSGTARNVTTVRKLAERIRG
jgi:uncharacterized protein (DUF1697 family)